MLLLQQRELVVGRLHPAQPVSKPAHIPLEEPNFQVGMAIERSTFDQVQDGHLHLPRLPHLPLDAVGEHPADAQRVGRRVDRVHDRRDALLDQTLPERVELGIAEVRAQPLPVGGCNGTSRRGRSPGWATASRSMP